ncbi:hypothetical protein Goarm_023366 [Gossypium armourianum]|uniref:VTT domain-containing protein n=1 Tax=Gossypium armourianum TaxID=34283 RepID=A0A7J9KII2_9ROSI|nr:hypothetical protein [Gossypium armourianum]
MAFTRGSALRIALLLVLLAAIIYACFTLPIEAILKDFLLWVEKDLGPWGPLVLAVAYIPLTVLAVPASVLTLGGGYLFGLLLGFISDSIGATVGAGAAFLLGRTIGRSLVVTRLKDYPQFRLVAIAIQRSGFKVCMLHYFAASTCTLAPFQHVELSVVGDSCLIRRILAGLLVRDGDLCFLQPITLALVYVGTTLKDLSDVTHGWNEFSTARWAFLILGLVVSGKLLSFVNACIRRCKLCDKTGVM